MVYPKFRIYYKGNAPEGADIVQPAIATRQHTLGDPFPYLGHTWELIGMCRMLGINDANGIEMCEGDVVRMPNGLLGVIYYNPGDCSYVIVARDDIYVVGFKSDGKILQEVVGNRFVMAEEVAGIVAARMENGSEARP